MLRELALFGIAEADVLISSNVRTRLDGMPRSDQAEPADPGVAVYWRAGKQQRCMAIDRYTRVPDNLAAIAATLEAMRAIERHGGASILDRAFSGFIALPAPEQWFQVLGVSSHAAREEIEAAHRRLAMQHHPDRGGEDAQMARVNAARDEGLRQVAGS
ncbi:MAG: J domain-containing protein [Terriglobales bacterium]